MDFMVCKKRLTEADTQTIQLSATPSGLTSAHLHRSHFLQAGCPSCHPTNSVKALKAVFTRRSTHETKQRNCCQDGKRQSKTPRTHTQLHAKCFITPLKVNLHLLWSPYVIGQTIIFSSCSFFLLSIFFFLA